MSTYQYYEWQTVDRPLTAQEMAELDELSSHIHVTSTGASVEYNWSDFSHDPEKVLARYFDAFLYMANWGSRRLAFRFPKGFFNASLFEPYLTAWSIKLDTIDDYWILDLHLGEAEIDDWIEGEGWLSKVSSLRNDILDGDLRSLYITWLAVEQHEGMEEDALEPPVPPGLKQLTPALATLIEIFDLDEHLISAAAKASPDPGQVVADTRLQAAISQLPRTECDDFLQRLLHNEPQLARAFKQRLQELAGLPAGASAVPGQRTFDELVTISETLVQEEKERKQQEAELMRRQHLLALAPQQELIWQAIHKLIERKQARPYDEAVSKLCDLRDLAILQDTQKDFQERLNDIHRRYARRHSLIERLQKAGLDASSS